jgi:hypothetical protein
MALQKTKSTLIGIDGNYWRIVQLNCNYDRIDAVCTIGLYVDETTRNAGANPIHSFKVDLSSQFHDDTYTDGSDVMKNISLKEAYKALKDLAIAEEAKPEPVVDTDERKNDDLAFFNDALDV